LKITFLGTGTSQGVPLIACQCEVCKSLDYRDKRLRTSVLIEVNGLNIAIDAGPDFRQQMLSARVSKLDALLITHEHKDHLAGLDDVRAFNYLQDQSMPLYSMQRVLDHIRIEFAYAFAERKYPGVPQIELIDIDKKPFKIGGVEIIPIKVTHAKLAVLGFRIGNFSYVTDANFLSEEAMNIISGSEVFVLNALQREPHISHFTLEEAKQIARKSGVPNVYFTHISHKMGKHSDVEKELPPGVQLANDGLYLEIKQ